ARIRKQIKSAVTDTGDTPEGEMSAGVTNLFTLLKACEKMEAHTALMDDYRAGSLKYVDLKQAVADALVEKTTIFRANKAELLQNKKEIKQKIKYASAETRKQAQATLKDVKDLTGLMNIRF
ncbi:MAG: tryptophan--tRNA ligase, partial [Bacteroidota bacterium]